MSSYRDEHRLVQVIEELEELLSPYRPYDYDLGRSTVEGTDPEFWCTAYRWNIDDPRSSFVRGEGYSLTDAVEQVIVQLYNGVNDDKV